ncbi:MAG: hypothetical protein HQM09_14625 [Candidatus Riflebacteria bacterium]|nr:hypothetical protein [Candidatus Riflebacteria bacterium]
MGRCSLCDRRKGQRGCPALKSAICSACCGVHRGKEVTCPENCTHLLNAESYQLQRRHESELAGFEAEMRGMIGHEEAFENELRVIEGAISGAASKNPDIVDGDVAQALDFLLRVGKNRLFSLASEPRVPSSGAAHDVVNAIEAVFKENITSCKDKTLRDFLKCLYRVHVSVQDHYDPSDATAYLTFIDDFVSPPGSDDEIAEAFFDQAAAKARISQLVPGETIKMSSFFVTWEPIEDESSAPNEIRGEIEILYEQMMKHPENAPAVLQKLLRLLEKYPDQPILLGYLANTYKTLQDDARFSEVARNLYEKHPNYLFGRLLLAEKAFRDKEYDLMPSYLDGKQDLSFLYPDRKVFHVSEVLGFNSIWALYFWEKGDILKGKIFADIICKIEPDHRIAVLYKEAGKSVARRFLDFVSHLMPGKEIADKGGVADPRVLSDSMIEETRKRF